MTTTVGSHGLSCLTDDDYAGLALYMQDQANAVEAALGAVSDSLDTAATRPVVVATSNLVNGPVASAGETIFGINGWVIDYSNFTPTPTTTAGIRFFVPKTGWYEHGAYMNMQAAGAVTPFSRRTAYSRAYRFTSLGNVLLSQVAWRTVDTNTGGEFLAAVGGTFFATEGSRIDILPGWSHANAASMVQLNAGAHTWCFYIGSGVEIGSA